MIHLVYPIGGSSVVWKHNELRYSLRSVHHHVGGPAHVSVHILGAPPSWLDRTHVIPTIQQKGVNADQIHKLNVAMIDPYLPDRFIWMNKDFYLLKEPQWSHYFHREKPGGRVSHHGDCWNNTVTFLAGMEINEPRDFELHIPMALEKSNLAHMLPLLPHGDLCLRSIYGNMFLQPSESTPMVDVKLPGSEIPARGWWCCSSDDGIGGKDSRLRAFLDLHYPEPSPWEH